MKTIEEYAIKLIVDGAESTAEDDLNEDGDIADDQHEAACDLAIRIAHAIRDHSADVLNLWHKWENEAGRGSHWSCGRADEHEPHAWGSVSTIGGPYTCDGGGR